MKKWCKEHILIALIVVALSITAVLYSRLWSADEATFWSTEILFITGIILTWYTYETSQIRKATIRQVNLQSRPYLKLQFVDSNKYPDRFTAEDLFTGIEVINVGNSVARNIKIAIRWTRTFEPVEEILTELQTAFAISPHGSAMIQSKMPEWLRHFDDIYSLILEIVVIYNDIDDNAREYGQFFQPNEGTSDKFIEMLS
ncbi:MAG: hypothetical protein AAB817_01405 [Patescibacteria group bacterium]